MKSDEFRGKMLDDHIEVFCYCNFDSYRNLFWCFCTWGFMKRIKEEGRAKHIGFSFHDSAEVLEGILASHPEMEFVQLQINYADWEDDNVQSRKCYEVARKYNVCLLYTSRCV